MELVAGNIADLSTAAIVFVTGVTGVTGVDMSRAAIQASVTQ